VQLEETPPVTASPARLGQILLNLLQNAAQAVEAREERGEIFVRCRAQDGEVQIEVEDTGQGMSPEVMERVFQPFFTTKGESRGTGLGLYLSRQLAEEMGGTLEVRSTLGSGSTFTLRLPAASTVTTSADAPAAPARPASRA
ncbi:MAG TPA: hybrid sensor histidine kinase/response regulator, partial [Myxococcales bacterium]|nr:hybrid sensor histidine kinase/response regulator [Myxococcales bacterium]